jgi:hypothetical protein
MTQEIDSQEDIGQAFEILAELVNQLPEERRAALRSTLGLYTHDLKHTLGLVTGANGVLLRLDLAGEELADEVREMAEMITHAAGDLDAMVMLLVDHLSNQIEID